MAVLTPEHASDIITQLTPTLDVCRSILIQRQQSRTWLKNTSDGRREAVTDLDLIVQEKLIAAVHAVEPGASIVGEESEHDPAALDDDLCFVIDPVDGTDLLIGGKTGFAVSIAIVSAHRVLAGVLDFPARNQRFTSLLGGGAALNGQRIQLHSALTPASARVAVSSTQRAMPSLEPLWSNLAVAALIPTPGFTAKIGSILVGECDAAVYLPIEARSTFIWDYAAAALLLREAHGRLTTLEGHSFLDTLLIQQSEGWLAASDNLHPSMQAAVTVALRTIRTR